MIEITIDRSRSSHNSGRIDSFHVEGHADFAEHGNDIVCAGVSTVTFGTVNAIEALTGVHADVDMSEGSLHVVLPEVIDSAKQNQVQMLLESMVTMLDTMEKSYGDHITIHQNIA